MKDLDVANVALKGFLLSAFCFGFLDIWFLNLFYADTPDLRAIWIQITHFGNPIWVLIGSLVLMAVFYGQYRYKIKGRRKGWWKKRRQFRQVIFIFAAITTTGITSLLLNISIGRAQPYLIETAGPRGFSPFAFEEFWASLPSGHSTTAFAVATSLALIVPKFKILFFALAALTAISNAIVGAHYLSDIVAGSTIGLVGAVLMYRLLDKKFILTIYPRSSHAGDNRKSDISS